MSETLVRPPMRIMMKFEVCLVSSVCERGESCLGMLKMVNLDTGRETSVGPDVHEEIRKLLTDDEKEFLLAKRAVVVELDEGLLHKCFCTGLEVGIC